MITRTMSVADVFQTKRGKISGIAQKITSTEIITSITDLIEEMEFIFDIPGLALKSFDTIYEAVHPVMTPAEISQFNELLLKYKEQETRKAREATIRWRNKNKDEINKRQNEKRRKNKLISSENNVPVKTDLVEVEKRPGKQQEYLTLLNNFTSTLKTVPVKEEHQKSNTVNTGIEFNDAELEVIQILVSTSCNMGVPFSGIRHSILEKITNFYKTKDVLVEEWYDPNDIGKLDISEWIETGEYHSGQEISDAVDVAIKTLTEDEPEYYRLIEFRNEYIYGVNSKIRINLKTLYRINKNVEGVLYPVKMRF